MKLYMQVGLGPGHIVLDDDPAPPAPKGHSPAFSAHICCGQMAARIKMSLGMELGSGPGDFVLDGDPVTPLQKGGGAPKFSAHVYCGQTAGTWHGSRPQPRRLCVRWGPSTLPQKGVSPSLPNFRPTSVVAKRLDALRCHLVSMQASAQGTLC